MSTAVEVLPTQELNDPDFLRKVNALRETDNVTNWLYLAREYLVVAALIGGTVAFYYWLLAINASLLWAVPVTLVTIVCVGAAQHRLATLTHEAAHYMLFRNRLLNELVSELCCMFPILGTTHSYRVQHLGHHQYPNDPDRDPDWAQMRLSGHRFEFPMSTPAFLWHCLFKQLLWPPALLRYVLVRASFLVDQGEGPYRMKRRTRLPLRLLAVGYHVSLVAILVAGVWLEDTLLLGLAPPLMLLGVVVAYALLPERWFAEYVIKPDVAVRWNSCLRALFNTTLWSGIAWATLLTGMPWWLFYFILWLVPIGTSFAFFMILRQIVQHGNADRERYTNTRVFLVNPLISMAVFPIGNDYHLPHHLFPLVPHYNLRKLHDLLLQTEAYRRQVVVVKGYFVPPERPPENPTVVDVMTR